MLTIGQLAAYAGVTVRAVRHYHAKGLLPEPERDYSGYRRYDAHAVVELIKIRTLAEASVPLLSSGLASPTSTGACVQRSGSTSGTVSGSRSWRPGTAWPCPRRRWPTSTGCGPSAFPSSSWAASVTPGSWWPPSSPSRCRST